MVICYISNKKLTPPSRASHCIENEIQTPYSVLQTLEDQVFSLITNHFSLPFMGSSNKQSLLLPSGIFTISPLPLTCSFPNCHDWLLATHVSAWLLTFPYRAFPTIWSKVTHSHSVSHCSISSSIFPLTSFCYFSYICVDICITSLHSMRM